MSQSSNLVATLMQYLDLRGIPAWRNNSGVFCDSRGIRRIRAGIVGGPDILGILPAGPPIFYEGEKYLPSSGRLLGVEAKTGSGRSSAAQRAWGRAAQEAGALYIVAYTLDDLRNGLHLAGYPERR